MTQGKEHRRYPKRYSTQVPIEFLDRSKAKGMLVNLSRDGVLVTGKKLKNLNSFVRLVIFLPGVEKGVTINGKIVRHTIVNQENAMGIQFLEQDATNRDAWLNYLSAFARSQKMNVNDSVSVKLPIETASEADTKPAIKVDDNSHAKIELKDKHSEEQEGDIDKESTFILKFKSGNRMHDFFPQDWENEDFFLRTNIKKDKGTKILIRMVHPETKAELKLKAIVHKYGRHPHKAHKEGLFFKLVNYDGKVENKIKTFLQVETEEPEG